jgi:2-polyprenyl-3-methyl-5-hydroxy-6-metoxy-1,4-benzoquinol methylase
MTTCYLCGGAPHRERPGSVRDNINLKVLECNACGLVFLSSIEHIHPSHYAKSGMHGKESLPIESWLRETDTDDTRRFRFLQPMLVGKKLLDFGCGAGGFLFKAREVTLVAEGLEPELRLHNHFEQSGLKVHMQMDDLVVSGLPRFDVVTAFHVVEHLPDPRSTLAHLASLLNKAGGKLVVEVPSSDDALLTLFGCEPFTHFTYWSQHLFLFNARTLSELVRQAGLKLHWLKQVQRYPLSNHLHWLSQGKPGGHQEWAFIDSLALNEAYSAQLAALGRCDTLLAGIGCD